jgi:hypothetical protein
MVMGRSGQAACAMHGNALLAERPAMTPRLLIMAVLPLMTKGSNPPALSTRATFARLRGIADGEIRALVKGRDLYEGRH